MLWPAVEKNKRRARFSGSCDVHAQPRRLDDLVINSGNSRQVEHSGRSLRSLLPFAQCDSAQDLCNLILARAIGVSVYHGHDGMRSWFGQLDDAWEELRVEPEAYFDLGQQTLLFYVLHGRGRKSGAEVAMQGAQLFRRHDGRGVYGKTYAHREDALGDLGLSEDALEPIAPWVGKLSDR
jgi:hypothetical protein